MWLYSVNLDKIRVLFPESQSPSLSPEALGLLSDIRVFSLPEQQYFQQPQVPLFSALYSEWDFCCNYSFHGQHCRIDRQLLSLRLYNYR